MFGPFVTFILQLQTFVTLYCFSNPDKFLDVWLNRGTWDENFQIMKWKWMKVL